MEKITTINIRIRKETMRVDFWINGQQFHTDASGKGLWLWDDYLVQILGNQEFDLNQKTISGKWKYISKNVEKINMVLRTKNIERCYYV